MKRLIAWIGATFNKEIKRSIILIIIISLCILGVIGFNLLLSGNWTSGSICFGVFLFFFIFFGLKGLKIVHQQEVLIVEFFGKYYATKNPGLTWICPVVMKVKRIVLIWEQPIDLFSENTKIDFKGGGYAKLVKPKAWLKIVDPVKATYDIDDWKIALSSKMENLFRDFLSNQTVEEVIDQANIHPWWELIKDSLKEAKSTEDPQNEIKESWGIKVNSITLEDFDWSDEVVSTRRDLFKAKREKERQENLAEAAPYEAKARARETIGSLVEMASELTGKDIDTVQKEIDATPELRKELLKFAKEVVTRRMSLDKGALTDIRVDGAQGIEKGLLEIVALWKAGIGGGKTDNPVINKEKEEELEIEKIREAGKIIDDEEFNQEMEKIKQEEKDKK